jgi:hypothetical protein
VARFRPRQDEALPGVRDDPSGRGSGWRAKQTRGWDRLMMERYGITEDDWKRQHAAELKWFRDFRRRVAMAPNPYEPREPRTFPAEGLKRREAGMAQVSSNTPAEWQESVLEVIREIARVSREFTVSRIRYRCRAQGIEDPHHPNAWGPVLRYARDLGLIEKAGRTVPSTYPPESHGRQVPVYRSLML